VKPQRIGGLMLVVVGVVLFFAGDNSSDLFVDQRSEFAIGHFSSTTAWYMLGGLAMAVGGTTLLSFSKRRKTM